MFVQYDMPDDDYYVPGDVNVGAVLSLSTIESGRLCGRGIGKPYIQFAQSIIFAVNLINDDPNLLPNITLGYVFLNDCLRQSVALSQSTKFIKLQQCVREGCMDVTSGERRKGQAFYNVVAQVAGYQSKYMVLVGAIFSQHRQNVLGVSTSNELSDKERFEYFTRTVPADSNRARAMVEVIDYYKWTYIATYGSQGSYGENGLSFIHKFAKEKGICTAYSKVLPPTYTDSDYEREIENIRQIGKVRVLTFFLLHFHVDGLLNAIGRLNASAEFVIISAEGFGFQEAAHAKENGLNTISILESFGKVNEFYEYYTGMTPFNNRSGNPWFGEYTEDELGCAWNIPEGKAGSCHKYKTYRDVPEFKLSHHSYSFIDQVFAVAYAVHNLITNLCPKAFHDKSLLSGCIDGRQLLHYIRSLNYQGMSYYIRFDKNGDLVGKYDIMTSIPDGENYRLTKVGEWDMLTEKADLDYDLVRFYDRDNGKPVLSNYIPESVCAKPCKNGQFYIQGELECCWECRYCRNNEIVRADRQGCITCEENFWPEAVNASICEAIEPEYMLWSDPIAMGLVALASASFLVVFAITGIFYKHRERKVIKGSNKELMLLIQLGLVIAYVSVFAFVTKPTKTTCYINFFGFNLSCTLIFGPLLIKTNRLYRIFSAAQKCRTTVKMVDMTTVLFMSFSTIIIQVSNSNMSY